MGACFSAFHGCALPFYHLPKVVPSYDLSRYAQVGLGVCSVPCREWFVSVACFPSSLIVSARLLESEGVIAYSFQPFIINNAGAPLALHVNGPAHTFYTGAREALIMDGRARIDRRAVF